MVNAQINMKVVERNHVNISYTKTGKGDTTLLFVHGSFINKEYWAAQVEYFSHHYQVVAIDLPGHGQSGKNRTSWTIQEFGEDVCTLIQELQLKNIVLIGHSMGGDVILEASARCPNVVIGFIGIDNFKNAGTEMSAETKAQVDQIMTQLKSDFSNTSGTFARQILLSPTTDKKIVDKVVSDFRNMDKILGIDIIYSAFTYGTRERELMRQMKLKMYLINVDNIPTNEEPLKNYASVGYEIIPIKGSCHFPMIENSDVFNLLLQDILIKMKNR